MAISLIMNCPPHGAQNAWTSDDLWSTRLQGICICTNTNEDEHNLSCCQFPHRHYRQKYFIFLVLVRINFTRLALLTNILLHEKGGICLCKANAPGVQVYQLKLILCWSFAWTKLWGFRTFLQQTRSGTTFMTLVGIGINLSSSYHVMLGLYSTGTTYDRHRLVYSKICHKQGHRLKKGCVPHT